MPAVSHVFRRGAVYYWRRRIIGVPAGDAVVVVVSLGTKDQDVARRRGAALTHMSEQLFEEIRLANLSPEAARAILTAAALEQSDLLARAATADRARSEPEPMSGARADRVVGAVYKLLAERGTSAQLDADSAAFLARCGLPAAEAFQVQATLDVLRRQGLFGAGVEASQAARRACAGRRALRGRARRDGPCFLSRQSGRLPRHR